MGLKPITIAHRRPRKCEDCAFFKMSGAQHNGWEHQKEPDENHPSPAGNSGPFDESCYAPQACHDAGWAGLRAGSILNMHGLVPAPLDLRDETGANLCDREGLVTRPGE